MNMRNLFLAAALAVSSVSARTTFTNDIAEMSFDGAGRIISLRERDTGRELVEKEQRHQFTFIGRPGKLAYPVRMEPRGNDRWAWILNPAKGGGEVVFSVKSFGKGWTFTCEKVPEDAERVFMLEINIPKWCNQRGYSAHMLSDDDSGICTRSYDVSVAMRIHSTYMRMEVEKPHPLAGWRAGMVVGARRHLVEGLRQMTREAGVPTTINGGAWSLGAEANRGSYVFADLWSFQTDDWIDLALRGGLSTIHLHSWWKSLGHYRYNKALYPEGAASWSNTVAKIHAAGLKAGFHTLTGCIRATDEWVASEDCTNLLDRCTHKLTRPFAPEDTVLYVDDMPDNLHHTFLAYGSYGNAIRIGREVFQYTGVKRDKPYAFTGIKRAAFKTPLNKETIPAGEEAHCLFQHYAAFYPKPDSPLADKLGEEIGLACKEGNLDQIYLDGAEGVTDRYVNDKIRDRIVPHLPKTLLIEGSNNDAYNWWFLSRYGAWDRVMYGVKRLHDTHLRLIENARKGNLLEPQMGWWMPWTGCDLSRTHMLDDMEYFASHNAGVDTASALQGMNNVGYLPYSTMRQLTLYGWYERFRLARAFAPGVQERFAEPRSEYRLRQGKDGAWTVAPVTAVVQRVTGHPDGSDRWSFELAEKRTASIRVEALWTELPAANAVTLVSPDDMDSLSLYSPTTRVSFALAKATDTEHGEVLDFKAHNRSASPFGACAIATRKWEDSNCLSLNGNRAFGAWVKGDGKGGAIIFEVQSPRLYGFGISHHVAWNDFTGWRHLTFLLRERDADAMRDFAWPVGFNPMPMCASRIDTNHVGSVAVMLNDLPCNRDVNVQVGEIHAMRAERNRTSGGTLAVNGRRIAIPFAMESGEFAELDGGEWRRYSSQGDLLEKTPGPQVELSAGENVMHYAVGKADRGTSRAEVTVFACGKPNAALKPMREWNGGQKKSLSYEAVMPSIYAPSRGVVDLSPIAVRPGEKATLQLFVRGPVDDPAICIGGGKWTFPAKVGAGQRLLCRDGVNWMVQDRRRRTLASGKLETPLPTLTGANGVVFGSAAPEKADAMVEFVKRYVE